MLAIVFPLASAVGEQNHSGFNVSVAQSGMKRQTINLCLETVGTEAGVELCYYSICFWLEQVTSVKMVSVLSYTICRLLHMEKQIYLSCVFYLFGILCFYGTPTRTYKEGMRELTAMLFLKFQYHQAAYVLPTFQSLPAFVVLYSWSCKRNVLGGIDFFTFAENRNFLLCSLSSSN